MFAKWKLLGLLVCGILASVAGFRWLEHLVLYPGSVISRSKAPASDLAVEDLVLASADGNTIHAWWSVPPGWKPEQGAILFSHGNGSNLSMRQGHIRRWRNHLHRGVLVYDYPGYGKSTGSPSEAGCFAAAEAAHHWLVKQARVPEKEIVLVGESLGSAAATELASRHPCRLLVLVAAFTGFPDLAWKVTGWYPIRWLVHNQLDNLHKISKVTSPVFVMHGRLDRQVPLRHGERLFAQAQEPKRFFPMEEQSHQHPWKPEFFEAVLAFLDETAEK